jgi:hypothetical protein
LLKVVDTGHQQAASSENVLLALIAVTSTHLFHEETQKLKIRA